jgi:hypothetical protein
VKDDRNHITTDAEATNRYRSGNCWGCRPHLEPACVGEVRVAGGLAPGDIDYQLTKMTLLGHMRERLK